MRAAEDYVKMYADFREDLNMTDSIKLLVETVRKETIKKCSVKAYNGIPAEYAMKAKQSILSLINEIK